MSTSLAEQLRKLAVPQSSVFGRNDKKRVSLLFDPKEAANHSLETFYQIGLDGLEELIGKNECFEAFRSNLFHIPSRDFERSVQDDETNHKLDQLIKHFLLCLSPYFMLHCAYKALEWLIVRYQIHEYNKEDVLMLILPYHETNIFARTLQLLDLKRNDEWNWLETLQKPGIHLPKSALYNHAASSPYFIRFVSKTVKAIVEKRVNGAAVFYNFYCATFTGALEFSGDVNENLVTEMVPVVLKGLNSPILDYCAASYVVLAKLVSKVTLSEVLLKRFVEKVTDFSAKALQTEAVMVLIILYQKQDHFERLGDSAQKIISAECLTEKLRDLQQKGTYIAPFLKVLMAELIRIGVVEDSKDARYKCMDLLEALTYDKETIRFLISEILMNFNPKRPQSEAAQIWISDFLRKLETSYPSEYDSEIIAIMKTSEGPHWKKKQKRLRRFIENSLTAGGHYEVFDNLRHPDATIRRKTMLYVEKALGKTNEREKQFLKASILQHLLDSDSAIVADLLRESAKLLTRILEPHELIRCLVAVLNRFRSEEESAFNATKLALQLLCSIADGEDLKIFLTILPYLLPTSKREAKLACVVLKSNYAEKNRFLKPVYEQLRAERGHEPIFNAIYNNLRSSANLPDIRDLLMVFKSTELANTDTETKTETRTKSDVLYKFLATLLLSNTLPSNCPADVTSLILDILMMYLETSKMKPVLNKLETDSEVAMIDLVKSAKGHKFPLQGLLLCVETLILKTKKPDVSLSKLDLSSESDFSKFFLVLARILLKGCALDRKPVFDAYNAASNKFLSHFVHESALSERLNAYLNMALVENKYAEEPNFRLNSLRTVFDQINNADSVRDFSDCLDLNNLFVPFLIPFLGNSEVALRKLAVDCLDACGKINAKTRGTYESLRRLFLGYKEELLLDHNQLPTVMDNVFKKLAKNGDDNEVINALVAASVDQNNPVSLRARLAKLLSKIEDARVFEGTAGLACQMLKNAQQENVYFPPEESRVIYYNCLKFSESLAPFLQQNSAIWALFKQALSDFKRCLRFEDVNKSPALVVLETINAAFFAQLKEPLQKELLDALMEIGTFATEPEVLSEKNRFVKKIDLDMNLLLHLLTEMRNAKSAKDKTPARRRRVSAIPTPDILDTPSWRKGLTVLETMQDKKKIRFSTASVAILFEILKKCLDFDEQAGVEYPKQLVLANILHCCAKLTPEELQDCHFNIELVVQCIRASQNPQTHHHALLVLAQSAAISPKQVLHHTMAIFTFMGSSVLRHDDAYSLQIITKIIDTIVPILTQDSSNENVINVLRVFVDVILDVPEHRRIPMYKNLLKRLNEVQHLYLFLLLMFEAHVTHSDGGSGGKKESGEEMPKRLQICANLCREFPPGTTIESCVKLIQYAHKLPEDKPDSSGDSADLVFDFAQRTPKQFRHYKYTIATFTAAVLSSTDLVNRVAELPESDAYELEGLYKDMIVNTLTFVQTTAKVAQKNADSTQAQYWKVMLHHAYDILDSVNALLTPKMFLLVVKGLMAHSLATVKRRAMELLNSKLQQNDAFFDECLENEQLHALLPSLVNMIKLVDEEDVLDSEQELIVQTALLTMKLLARVLSTKSPEKFVAILTFLTDLLKKSEGNLLASLLLCIAELCHCMQAHSIQSLSKFMPCVVKVLRIKQHQSVSNLLLLSGLTALSKVLDSLPLFLSPFLEKLLHELSSLSCKFYLETDDAKVQPIVAKIAAVKRKIGCLIPLRVLVPNISAVYASKVHNGDYASISALMQILTEAISAIERPELQNNLPELNAFFLSVLDFRVVANGQSPQQVDTVEGQIVDSFITYVLKLSESTFRPIYYRIYDWSVRTDVRNERIITFYHLSHRMAERLKGLFVNFAAHFIANAAKVLNECNLTQTETLYFKDDSSSSKQLLEHVLKTLMYVFMHDGQKFVNKERFGVLMQPLVDQLENELEDQEDLEQRASSLLVPCLVHFAVAAGSDALWKQANYQILLKMRHSNAGIRMVALRCVTEVARKLGEDFLPLLAETIPFLAELLEDEDERVERACQKAVQELERILGEPLQKYF